MGNQMTRERKITLAAVLATVFFCGIAFVPWMLENRDGLKFIPFILAFFSVAVFGIALAFGIKNVARDVINPHECEKTFEKATDVKTFWITTGAFLVWGFALFIFCGLMKTGGNLADFWPRLEGLMRSLDSNQYIYIAENWYTDNGNLATDVSIVFLPGYPVIVKLIGKIIGNYYVAGEIVSMVCFAFAGGFMYLLAGEDGGTEKGKIAALMLAVFPGSFFFITPMSESLFLMLTLGSLYFIRKKKWLPAALMGCYAAFTRSVGVFVAVVFVYELALDFWQGEHSRQRLGKSLLRLLYVLIIPVGLIAYLIVNKAVTGDALKFLYYQRTHWGQSLGFFFGSVNYMAGYFKEYVSNGNVTTAVGLWLMGLIAIFATLVVLAAEGRKLRTSYFLYSLAYFVFSMGATHLLSAPRYALGMFTFPIMLGGTVKNKFAKSGVAVLLLCIDFIYMYMFAMRWQVW